MKERRHKDLRYFVSRIAIVIGIVLIWRGIWYVLDEVDYTFFGGYGAWTGIGGILIGTLLLYLPDRDLKEIEKL